MDLDFYTDACVYGDEILVIGYKDGIRRKATFHHKPTIYVERPELTEETPYRSFPHGKRIYPMKMDSIKAMKLFVASYKDQMAIFGQPNVQYSYIHKRFPKKINYDVDLITVGNLDIEVDSSDGFPEPRLARSPIITITLKVRDIFWVFGTKPYKVTRKDVIYTQCVDEVDLLHRFVDRWHKSQIDVITGWYVNAFDIPYIFNRLINLGFTHLAKKLSPWGKYFTREPVLFGQPRQFYNIVGIAILDYIDLYQKFTYSQQESYKLNHIAYIELGMKKIDYSEHQNLQGLYEKDPQKFIDYNIRDVELVDKLEQKMKLIELAYSIAYDARINFTDVFGTVRLWDTIITNALYDMDIMVPISVMNIKTEQIRGAYVKEPVPGLYKWCISTDVRSEYPTMVMQMNISPETILNGDYIPLNVEELVKLENFPTLKYRDHGLSGNGFYFNQKVRGILPTLMEKVFDDRNRYKKEMIAEKNKLEAIEAELKRRGLQVNNALV